MTISEDGSVRVPRWMMAITPLLVAILALGAGWATMEANVGFLRVQLSGISQKVDTVDTRLRGIEIDVAKMRGEQQATPRRASE